MRLSLASGVDPSEIFGGGGGRWGRLTEYCSKFVVRGWTHTYMNGITTANGVTKLTGLSFKYGLGYRIGVLFRVRVVLIRLL